MAPLFDLDGVFTSPETKRVNPEIIQFVSQELHYGKPVGLATGRAWSWVQREILNPILEELGSSTELLDMLFISCEKGAVTICYEKGEPQKRAVEGVAVPDELMQRLSVLVPEGAGVFIDPEKEHMFSVEMEKTHDQAVAAKRKEVLQHLREQSIVILHEYPDFEAEQTVIALDIQKRGVDKKIAGQEFYDFLHDKNQKGKGKHPQEYFIPIFGDSESDALAAIRLHELGVNTAFAYVGHLDLKNHYDIEVQRPKDGELHDIGTLALLKEWNVR